MIDLSTFAPAEKKGPPKRVQNVAPGNVLVIGSGIFGAWSALKLLRSGYKVELVDLWGPGNSRSSSGGESRLIRSFYGENRTYFEMASNSWDQWLQLEQDQSIKILHHTGVLWMMPSEEEALFSKMVNLMEDYQHPFDVISPEDMIELFPLINNGDGYALIEKKAGFLEARKATNAVVTQFVKEGGIFKCGEVTLENNYVILNGGKVIAEAYLFACGPWLKRLFPFLQLQISRQEIYYFGLPEDVYPAYKGLIPWVDMNKDGFFYGIPIHDRRGFKIANDVRGVEVDPTTIDRMPSESLVDKSRHFLANKFPFLKDAPVLESRVCQYSNSEDGNFIFDQHPEHPAIWILGGGSGHGFKHGPEIGGIVSAAFQNGEIPSTFVLS